MDRFARTCLVLIVVLLGAIAFRPMVTPQAVHASARYTEYDAYVINQAEVNNLPMVLSKGAVNGWELVGVTSLPDFHNGSNAVVVFLAR
jgi:hypothetical protein